MANLKKRNSSSLHRRRFFWLVVCIATPVVLLTAVGLRALHYEESGVREDAIQKAKEAIEAAGSLMLFLSLPAESCQDAKAGFADLEQRSLFHPTTPEDDFVFRMQHYQPGSDLYAPMADYRFQACLLDENGGLLYPKPVDSRGVENLTVGTNRDGWAELEKSHELSRKLYQLFLARRKKSLSMTHGDDHIQEVTKDTPLMFYQLQTDQPWIAWRLQLGESKYQVLVALPLNTLRELTHRLLDPSRRRSGLPFDLPSYDNPLFHSRSYMFTYPRLEDYMELTIVAENNKLLIGSTGENAKWFWASGPAALLDAGQDMQGFLASNILASSGVLRQSVGASHISWVIEGGEHRLYGLSHNITMQVRVRDQDKLMAVVHRHRLWFASIVGFSSLGALIALTAAWKAFRQQEELSEMKTNFLSSVSHELRTPIASIRLMAEGLQRGAISDAAKQAEYFGLILQESRRVSGLVENVLDLSRIEQGCKLYSIEPCDLAQLVLATVKGLRPYAADKKVDLDAAIQGAAEPVDCDPIAMQQVLVNLVDNAIKHSPVNARVAVVLAFADQAVSLSVTDSGPGIPEADRAKIFEPFFRRGSELRRETQGVGLGLSIVHHVVEGHGGAIKVEGEFGHGSRFVVVLPIRSANTKAQEAAS